jgi:DNA-binding MarR family transcriptional regulator
MVAQTRGLLEMSELSLRLYEISNSILQGTYTPLPGELSIVTGALAKDILRARADLREKLPKGTLGDPTFEMLLAIYCSCEEGLKVSVHGACCSSGVPVTTALRWIRLLEQNGLVIRNDDPHDGRRAFLTLSLSTKIMIGDWLDKTGRLLLKTQLRCVNDYSMPSAASSTPPSSVKA